MGSAFLSQSYAEFFKDFLNGNLLISGLLYVGLITLTTVVAPLSSIPLIPILAKSWGIGWTVFWSVLGWSSGSFVVFYISRRFGVNLIGRFIDIEAIRKRFGVLPEHNQFWFLIFLRMTIPVDVLSYALGLFSDVKWKMYASTTVLGAIPMTFVLAYIGTLEAWLQAVSFALGILVYVIYLRWRRRKQ